MISFSLRPWSPRLAARWNHAGWLSTAPLRNAHIVYDRNRILFAGVDSPPQELLNGGRREPDLELLNYTLLPGLIDAHTHLFLEGGELDLDKRAAYLKQTPSGTFAACGVAARKARAARRRCHPRRGR